LDGDEVMARKRLNANGEPPRSHALVKTITIKGFKSIADAEIQLGRVNVFIGANGAGKTAILEAIGVAGAAADGRVSDDELMDRGVRPGVPRLFKSAFDEGTIPRGIRLSASSSEAVTYSVQLDNPQESAATPWRFMNESFLEGSPPRKILARSPAGGNSWDTKGQGTRLIGLDPLRGLARSRIRTLPSHVERLRGLLQNFRIYDPQTSVLRGIQGDVRQLAPIGLQGGRLAEAVAFLREDDVHYGAKLVEDVTGLVGWASDVETQSPSPDLLSPSVPALREIVRFTDKYLRRDRRVLSAYDASEGALYVLFALALIAHPSAPSFFAIENIDHALHPRLARALVRKIVAEVVDRNCQILLTTHNPLVLDGLALGDDDIRLFTVDRATNGHTVVSRVEYTRAIATAEKEGLTLSQMWVRGLIGGTSEIW
jgi:hypothetical protein